LSVKSVVRIRHVQNGGAKPFAIAFLEIGEPVRIARRCDQMVSSGEDSFGDGTA
jgi:hypothetical protein